MISQSTNAPHLYFASTDLELGLPTPLLSCKSTPALAPPPTPACVLASHVLASQDMHIYSLYVSSEPGFTKEPTSAISRMKQLLPKLFEKLKTTKIAGRFGVLLGQKRNESASTNKLEPRDNTQQHERRSCSSQSNLSDEDDYSESVWEDNLSDFSEDEDERKDNDEDYAGGYGAYSIIIVEDDRDEGDDYDDYSRGDSDSNYGDTVPQLS